MSQFTDEPLHFRTPYRESPSLSKLTGLNVWLKFENGQPSGSFKIRGIGHMCQKCVLKGCKRLVCSSGGNAGMAAAYAARKLSAPITIFVPQTTSNLTVQNLKQEGAEVQVIGSVWDEANDAALEFTKQDGFVYVPPFDNPLLWEGHSSIIKELDSKPDMVICSVGGGGLLCGVVQGLQACGWNDVPVLAVETVGAHSFNEALIAGHLVTLPGIASIAKSLGAKTVCQGTLEVAKEHPIIACTVTDKDTVKSMSTFLDDEKVLVEPACAASFAVLYNGQINKLMQERVELKNVKKVAVIVCGGTQITIGQLNQWKKEFDV
uniref:L-serine ammonia-lyase n=1 Tax=Phallusia mammillata TaxID=59560 RepID=A0A6F9DSQ7_9ASCI|nr:L-serine dehydratase/L-threonine deaminase-like [Phallusia mammillata]